MFIKNTADTPKVSIVVPVYNVEKYLRECLDSLLAQKLKDIEIIVVNDGSTDSSPDIIAAYAAKDSRVRVISKENEGYGKTMNRGFDAARGEYIGIVESDDFADPRMFKDMYKFAKKHNLDLVKANYYEHSDAGDAFQEPFVGFAYKQVFDPRVDQRALTVLPIIWSALYRKEMIVREGVRFNETPGASYQDTSFVFQAWASARRAAILPKGYLHYRVDNANSSVKSSSKVFAVCDEYALSERFLAKDPEKKQAFEKILNLLKLGTYRWNFNRLAAEYQRQFAERMREEYLEAREAGTLEQSMFAPQDWEMLNLLMDDFEGFMAKYESGL